MPLVYHITPANALFLHRRQHIRSHVDNSRLPPSISRLLKTKVLLCYPRAPEYQEPVMGSDQSSV